MLPTYEITAYGLYTTLPIVALHDNYELALLACTNDADEAVALVLERHKISRTVGAPFAKREVTDPDGLSQHQSWEELAWRPFLHPIDRKIRETTSLGYVRMVYLSGHSRWLHRNNGMGWFYYDMTMQRVCIVHRPQRETLSYRRGDGRFGPQGAPQLQVRVPARCRSRLATMGYAVSVYIPQATSTSANSDLRTTHTVSPLQIPAQPVIIAVFRCVSVDDSTSPVAIIRIAPSFCDCHQHKEGPEDSWYIRAYVTSPTGHPLEVADRSQGTYGRRRTRLCRRCRHDRYADVELWNRASAQDSPARWQRFYLPGPSAATPVDSDGAMTCGADAQTMVMPIWLELVREFVGDSKHPAVFSLSIEMRSPEHRFRAEANVSMAQSCLDLPGDQNKHGAGEGSKGGAEQGDMNLDKAGVGCNIDMARDACGASRLPVPRRARTISSPGMLTKICKHFKSLRQA